jgi:hypothetical protein
LLLRTHYVFKRCLELVGEAPVGHKYETNHQRLLVRAFGCTARKADIMTIRDTGARGLFSLSGLAVALEIRKAAGQFLADSGAYMVTNPLPAIV